MSARDWRVGWRLLAAEPAYSAVTVLGLAAGFATCFVLLAYVAFSFSYNRHVPGADQVYAIKQRINVLGKPGWFEASSLPLLRAAEKSGMTQAAALAARSRVAVHTANGVLPVDALAVTAGFPQVFGLRAEEGDLAQALARPDAVALTRDAAARLLGTPAALGKTLRIDGNTFTVAAILPEPPPTATLRYGLLGGLDGNLVPQGYRDFMRDAWGAAAGYAYVRPAPGVTAQALRERLQQLFDHSPLVREMTPEMRANLAGRKMIDIALTPLPALYFDTDLLGRPEGTAHGNRTVVLGLGAVGVLVLLLALANYVNLATVRTVRRQPEIVLRKVLGAGTFRLAGQFMIESLLVALLATALGLVLAWLLLPALSALLARPLAAMMTPAAVLAALAVGLLAGLLAGLYPAWIALDMRPAAALSTRPAQETGGGLWLRRALTVLQLTAAMGLTAATLAVAWQTRYASGADPGFDPAPLLVVELPRPIWHGTAGRQLRDALRHLPHVQGVAFSENAVGQNIAGNNGPIRRAGGDEAVLMARSVSPDFFDVYGVQARAGRTFSAKIERDDVPTAVMLNGAGAAALGFASPQGALGALVTFNHQGKDVTARVVGIAPDLRHESLRETPRPMFYRNALEGSVLTIRTDGDVAAVERQARELARRYFPSDLPVVRPAASYFSENYADDLRLAQLLGAASVVALLLSAFGIYVLAAYNVQRRAREIVLRKLFGAGRAAIARLLGREFALLLALGALIGLPPAALAIRAYLAGFVERAPVGGWPLAAAVVIAALVALAATTRHTIAALRAAPAAVLRH